MAVLKKIKENFGGAAVGVAMLGLGSTFAPAVANAQDVTIRYGTESDVKKMERYLKRAEKRGVKVELEGGLGKTDCFALFNEAGEEVVRSDSKKARYLVSLASDLEKGEQVDSLTIAGAKGNCAVDLASANQKKFSQPVIK